MIDTFQFLELSVQVNKQKHFNYVHTLLGMSTQKSKDRKLGGRKTRLICIDCNHPKSYHSLGHCSKFVKEKNRTCRCKGTKTKCKVIKMKWAEIPEEFKEVIKKELIKMKWAEIPEEFFNSFFSLLQDDEQSSFDKSAQLNDLWQKATEDQKKIIDTLFIILCGYSIESIIDKAGEQDG